MSLINHDSLKSFFGDSNLAIKTESLAFQNALKQAENIVFQNTLIPIPDNIEDAIPTLQFYAHTIFAYIFLGASGKVDDAVKQYREKMYEKVMSDLDQIRKGERVVLDTQGHPVISTSIEDNPFYCNNERSERL